MADTDQSHVVPYDYAWPGMFAAVAARLRQELGPIALRIDHIGSTAVPDLAAKPVIDIQISIDALEPVERYRDRIEHCGFVWRADNPDLTKRYFRERPGERRTHIHVRRSGSFAEQVALLFRDYLRTHRDQADRYAEVKYRLAHLLSTDRQAYVTAKSPFIWETIKLADEWAQTTGWEPGPSDA